MTKTKIVCTIGPACEQPGMLQKMIAAGMNVARLNFSHGYYKEFENIIKNIRTIAQRLDKNVAILQDLQGLKIRIGDLKQPSMVLTPAQEICFTIDSHYSAQEVPVQYKGFVKDLKVGERVLVADGKIELKVLRKDAKRVYLKVMHGGEIKSHKGINIPDSSVKASPITSKDLKDIDFGIQQKVDFIALSFVSSKKDILDLRAYLKRKKADIKIIAKIERKEALVNLEEIIQTADAVMVARGDLGVELSFEKVPLIQKRIIHLANQYGKPVITATQMLTSMMLAPVPTRAEVSDIANAVLDHSDAIMLSDETAVGQYPVEAVGVMAKTALEVEQNFIRPPLFWNDRQNEGKIPPIAVAYHGLRLAHDLGAKYIIVFTVAGFTAMQVAKFRSHIPVVVFTLSEKVKRELALVYGLDEVHVLSTFENKFSQAVNYLSRKKRLHSGENIVTVSAGKELREGLLEEIRVLSVS